jgi:hypothetical protein
VIAIVPAPLEQNVPHPEIADAVPALTNRVRGALVGMALGLAAVFGIAIWLNPYAADGSARRMETHRQLGLPECTFKTMTGGMPCPSCGMTTSFSLLIRGDLWNSLRANWVGTLTAVLCLTLIPWGIVSAIRGRPLFILSMERTLTRIMIAFVSLMLLRWVLVLGVGWLSGTGF